MITWLQTTFQKHHKWLLSLLLAVIIVTFVLTIGNQSFFGSGASRDFEPKEYYGYNLESPRDMQMISQHGQISAYLHPELGVRGPSLQQYSLARTAGLYLANQLGVEQPSSEQLQAYIESKAVFQNRETGEFDPKIYNNFMSTFASGPNAGLLGQVLREDWRIAQVRQALGGPGYVSEHEAAVAHQESNTTWQIKQARLSYSNFEADTEVEDADLEAYFNQNPQSYEIPERISVDLVLFPTSEFIGQVEDPAEAQLRQYFQANKRRFQPAPPPPNEDGSQPETPEVTFEEVRGRVLEAWKRAAAGDLSAKAADDFTVELFRQEIERGSEAFQAAVEQFGGEVESLDPYSRENPSAQQGISPQFLKQAFEVRDIGGHRYYTDINTSGRGAMVLIYKDTIAPRQPEFAEVKDEVAADYKADKKREQFMAHGEEIRSQLQEALANGQEFETAAEELGMETQSFDEFEGSNAPFRLRSMWAQIQELAQGEVSPMIFQGNNGLFAYVAKKDQPAMETESEDFKKTYSDITENEKQFAGWGVLYAMSGRQLAQYEPEAQEDSEAEESEM